MQRKKKTPSLNERVASVILAGGQGTRLYPLTDGKCKPAVSFGGRYRLIDIPISNSLNSRMNNIYVISQFYSSGLQKHVNDTYHMDQFQGGSLTFLCPEERPTGKIWYEGTADAVRKNIEHLEKLPIDYILILSGDQLYNMNLEAMVAYAKRKNADLTIAALPVPEEQAPRLGILEIDETGAITDFIEKPQDPAVLSHFSLSDEFIKDKKIKNVKPPCFLASMGIYVFKKEVLFDLLKEDSREDFGKHIIPTKIAKGKSFAFLHQGYWEDIGTIASYYEANLSLTTNSLGLDLYDEVLPIYAQNHHLPGARLHKTTVTNSIICDGSIIEAKEVDHSLIGVRGVIKKGTVIKKSVILGNNSYVSPIEKKTLFQIGENCHIEKAIIDENVTIGNNVRLTNIQNLVTYDGDGIFIRDGIIVVTSGTVLPNNFTL